MRSAFLFAICCLFLLGVPLHGTAAKGQEEAAELRINIGKVREGIAGHEEMVEEAVVEETGLLRELQQLDETISRHLDAMGELEQQVLDQEITIRVKEQELAEARAAGARVREHLEQRLRAFYLGGRTGFLNVAFSRRSLPELMLFHDAFTLLINHDKDVVVSYRTVVERIEQSKQVHELEKAVQLGFLNQAREEKAQLDRVQQEKQDLLATIKTRKGLYEQALKEMKKAEVDLASTLTQIKEKEEKRVRGFLLSKGELPPPVDGAVVRSFGESAAGSGSIDAGPGTGLTIRTADKAKVRAVYRGRVIFAGYMRGFGKMIVIDHGLQYYTVTARFEQLAVGEGDQVAQGQVLGTTGELATMFSEGLYFEIRHGAESQDPLDWLQPNAYAASTGK